MTTFVPNLDSMLELLLSIDWNVDPEIFQMNKPLEIGDFKIGPIRLRWYGLLFALGFLVCLEIGKRMFKKEGVPETWLESAFIWIFLGTVIGARLGHVFFYDWDYYSQHTDEILMIWRGGLASHGAVIGILTGLWIYSKTVSKRPFLWITDRAGAVIPLAGAFIRTGNLMNHEIYGQPADVPWAFVFKLVDDIPRHPTQIYEALAYLGVFALTMYLYWKKEAGKKLGMLTGVFFAGIFGARFIIEFLKENQSAFEANLPLNMGQLLSIPLVLFGIWLIVRAQQRGPIELPPPVIKEKKKTTKRSK